MEQLLNFLLPIIETYASSFPPSVINIFIIIGSVRIFVKPLMALFQAYVDFTPNTKDDVLPQKLKENKIYKAIAFGLDWFASIKLPKAKKK